MTDDYGNAVAGEHTEIAGPAAMGVPIQVLKRKGAINARQLAYLENTYKRRAAGCTIA